MLACVHYLCSSFVGCCLLFVVSCRMRVVRCVCLLVFQVRRVLFVVRCCCLMVAFLFAMSCFWCCFVAVVVCGCLLLFAVRRPSCVDCCCLLFAWCVVFWGFVV